MKTVKYYPTEFAYTCPYCDNVEGWCDEPKDKDTWCSRCRKDFKVEK